MPKKKAIRKKQNKQSVTLAASWLRIAEEIKAMGDNSGCLKPLAPMLEAEAKWLRAQRP
jgi:hypothetical protein